MYFPSTCYCSHTKQQFRNVKDTFVLLRLIYNFTHQCISMTNCFTLVRLCEDKLTLIEEALHSSKDAYKKYPQVSHYKIVILENSSEAISIALQEAGFSH